jgi:uncharacterized protein (TIGR03086 family)
VTVIDSLLAALEHQVAVARAIHPDDLERPSACDGWSIAEVLHHSVGVTRKLSAFASGATSAPHALAGDLIGADHGRALEMAMTEAREAWSATDLTRTCTLSFGAFTATDTAGINLFDVLAHTWDVAAAMQMSLSIPDELWDRGLVAARVVIEPDRDPVHYGAALDCPASAPAMTRFLAYLGRRG